MNRRQFFQGVAAAAATVAAAQIPPSLLPGAQWSFGVDPGVCPGKTVFMLWENGRWFLLDPPYDFDSSLKLEPTGERIYYETDLTDLGLI